MEYMKLGDLRQLSADYGEEYEDIIQELSNYKVKMENALCQTDIKEQDHINGQNKRNTQISIAPIRIFLH